MRVAAKHAVQPHALFREAISGMLSLAVLLMLQPPTTAAKPAEPIAAALWRFTANQDFIVEETHRQLLTVIAGTESVSTYIDYSVLIRYHVVAANRGRATLEGTVEKIRINNPNEAGARAVEAITKREKAKTTWRLTRHAQGWSAVTDPPSATAPPILLTLGSRDIADSPSWKQSWSVPLPTNREATLTLEATVRHNDTSRLQAALRTRWEPAPPDSVVTLTSLPVATSGIANYDRGRGRWEYADLRVKGVFTTIHAGRSLEIRQDLTSYYRLFDRMPATW